MTSFDDLFAAAALPSHVAHFGETILYRPYSGRPRRISAIVDRHPPEEIKETERGLAARLVIEVANDPLIGILSHLLDRGGDKVEVAIVKGGKPTLLGVTKLLSDKGGKTKFEVR